jgi:hypothetical protein
MMKYAFWYAAFLLLVACTQGEKDASDTVKCMLAARDELATTEISPLPNKEFRYIARLPDGSVWYVETMNSLTPKVTSKYQVFPPTAPKQPEHE